MQQNVLVIRFSSLGDVVLTSSAVTNIKINHPDCRLIYLTKARFAHVVHMIPGVDDVITIPENCGTVQFLKILFQIDKHNFDLVIDLHGNFRSLLARRIITAGHKVVYPKRRTERERIVRRKTFNEPPIHTIDAYNRALADADMITPCSRPIMITTVIKPEGGKNKERGIVKSIVIAPGAAHQTKRWPIERFYKLASLLRDHTNRKITWAVSESEKTLLDGISDEIRDERAVGLPVDQLAGLISRADLTISNDSGVAHLSSAVNTPVLALFGPTHPALGFSPRGLFDKVIEVDEPCRPCSLHGSKDCYREEQFCFTRIEADDVAQVAERMLMSSTSPSRAVFLDRDGTVIVDKDYQSDPEKIEFIPGSLEGMRRLVELGLKLVIVSNQSGISRGYFDLETTEKVNGRLLEMLERESVRVDGLYYCPHYPGGSVPEFSVECDCRKPYPGMAETAARQLGIDLRDSYVIGDKLDDVNLSLAIGATPLMVLTGHGEQQSLRLPNELKETLLFDDLLAAVNQIAKIEASK